MTNLVDFDRPPIDEVVLGRTFLQRPDFYVPYFGVFWERVRSAFPHVEQAPPLLEAGELSTPFGPQGIVPRVWFLSEDKTQLLQIQHGRIYFNWRRLGADQGPYIRFDAIKREFDHAWRLLSDLVVDLTGNPLQSTKGEMTYVNYIELEGKNELEIAEACLRDFVWDRSPRFLAPPTKMIRNWTFQIPDDGGELLVVLHSAKHNKTGADAIKLELTAKGPANDDAKFDEWAAKAHDFLVRGFVDLTTEKLHDICGLRRN